MGIEVNHLKEKRIADTDAKDAEVRSWISNVLVPAMVTEYLANAERGNNLAARIALVPKFEANGRLSAEAI
jgi:hypothetical protein